MNLIQLVGSLIVIVSFVSGSVSLVSRSAAKSQYAALRENYILMKERADDRDEDVITLKAKVAELERANEVLVNTANSSGLIQRLTELINTLTQQEQRNHEETIRVMRQLVDDIRESNK